MTPKTNVTHHGGFALVPVLMLLVLAGALIAVLSAHLAHIVREKRLQTLDLELRQMLDSAAAYAKLHQGQAAEPLAPLELITDELAGGGRNGKVVLAWMTSDAADEEASLEIIAEVDAGHGKTRHATIWIRQPIDKKMD